MMRQLWISKALLLVMVLVLVPSRPQAEQVPHHELSVEANGSLTDCLSCHDGASAKHVSFCKVRCDFSGSHSLMKRYPPAGKEARFAPISAIQAKGIKLENGLVTCNSCHDLRNSSPNHLIMKNTKSALCRTCHIDM